MLCWQNNIKFDKAINAQQNKLLREYHTKNQWSEDMHNKRPIMELIFQQQLPTTLEEAQRRKMYKLVLCVGYRVVESKIIKTTQTYFK